MSSLWKGYVVLMDDNEKTTRLSFDLGEITGLDFADEAGTARAIFTSWLSDLKAITKAAVYKSSLQSQVVADNEASPPASGADVSEQLNIIVHTNDSDRPTEVAIIRVPSPIDSVWNNNDYQQGLDKTSQAVLDFVEEYSSGVLFSDGDEVNIAEGTSGIHKDGGFWTSRRMRVD